MQRLHRRRGYSAPFALAAFFTASIASANVPVQRTFFTLPSSNGHGAIMLDLSQKKLTHFREHLFATEEPRLNADKSSALDGNGSEQPVATRGLLYDAYFGLRSGGSQAWLTKSDVDLDASGYAAYQSGKTGGTGVVTMVQRVGSIEITQYFFAPRDLPAAGFVMAARVKNTGSSSESGVSLFSIHNIHLGFDRPGVMQVIADNDESMSFDGSNGRVDLIEQGFAGVAVARGLGGPSHHAESDGGSSSGPNVFAAVDGGGTTDLVDFAGPASDVPSVVGAYQWDFGTLGAGEEKWGGVALAHDPNPDAIGAVQSALDAYVAGKDAEALVEAEIASWAGFQAGLKAPASATGEETLLRQSAVMLAMAQSQESRSYVREWLTRDGDPRYTRFPGSLPGVVDHRGQGQVIASLPPGEWTITWARDMAYSVNAMATLGMKAEAKDALAYTMNAEAGRFQNYDELKAYSMPPYQVSLVRYYGFGVEETDINQNGPNLEFDGLGLFLWAAHHYEELTGDESFVDDNWPVIATKIGDVLVDLVDPATGLLQKDSSIWETHWNGDQRSWTYSNIAAVRGLCDASTLASRKHDAARAQKYRAMAEKLRENVAEKLTDKSHALGSNLEEVASGEGYWDAAVFEGIAMGLFDPKGVIAKATFAGIDAHLSAPAGSGWSRNDDRTDHRGGNDLSPWGGEYDSAEWIFTDMRGAVAARAMNDDKRADALVGWVRDQSLKNYLAISETYDEGKGTYKFNAPMIGFGAGAFILAVAGKGHALDGPACGKYYDESAITPGGTGGGGSGGAANGGGGSGGETGSSGCGCRTSGDESSGGALGLALAAALGAARRRRPRR